MHLIDFFPREVALDFGMMDIAPFSPKIIERDEVFGSIRVDLGAIWNAETDMLELLIMGSMSFSGVEEMMPDATPAVTL